MLRRIWILVKDAKTKSRKIRVIDGGEEFLVGLFNWERVYENFELYNSFLVSGNRGFVLCFCDFMSQG